MNARLWILKIVCLLAIACVVIGGEKREFWPFNGWGMYSNRGEPFIAKEMKMHQIRVIDADGVSHRLWPKDAWLLDRDSIVKWIVKDAVRTDENAYWLAKRPRSSLMNLLEINYPDIDPAHVEIWYLTWYPNVMEIPPLDPMKPDREELLGTFDANDLSTIESKGASDGDHPTNR